MKRYNTTDVLDDLITYANRYGLDALGYAVLEMAKNDEIHFTSKDTENIWEFGGNKGENVSYEIGQFFFDIESNKLYFKSIIGGGYPTIEQAEDVISTYIDADENDAFDNDLEFDGHIKLYFISEEGEDKTTMQFCVSQNLCAGVRHFIDEYAKNANIHLKYI